ncbi:MAG: hypothetical protein JWQ33_171 [Ramlibacter sp.]|nr:hypothetical protein [Ramlibacter sp.]
MQRITPDRRWPLFDVAATRRIEQAAATSLPPHTLMESAGLAVARLALAVAPHGRRIWIACGPGNNGGDGLEAAAHLQRWGKQALVTWLGNASRSPADALASLERARHAGVSIGDAPPAQYDLAIDALLGIGTSRAPEGPMADWIARMNDGPAPVLAVDVPSGLDADTGTGIQVRATHTLSLLTLKPGLFTAQGRDASGAIWFDDLGATRTDRDDPKPTAWLSVDSRSSARLHGSHKGSYGDVAVIGGSTGMAGAALLAACAALHGGAGRVFVGLLDAASLGVDVSQPELMLRPWDSLDLKAMNVACGCGGGEAVRSVLPRVLSTSRALVLDADALNAIAGDPQLQAQLKARSARSDRATVITPHPLEAARLLACSSAQVQADRLAAASDLADRFRCVAVLKGSGSITAEPGRPPVINFTGNAKLATAGTGDVLAGMIAARMAQGVLAFDAASQSVQVHGQAADHWPAGQALTALALARFTAREQSR